MWLGLVKNVIIQMISSKHQVLKDMYDFHCIVNDKEMVFADGGIPSPEVVQKFVDLCDQRFGPNAENPKATISVIFILISKVQIHCMAGLGRAPTLVTIALIENGMSNVDAIQTVKKYR